MAVSRSFLTFVLEQLDGLRLVTHRRMFGGVGVYSDDVFFAVMDNDTLFFKVNDATRPRYEAAGSGPFVPVPGAAPMRGYYAVPVSVLEDADELLAWATDAVVVGAASPPKARKRRCWSTESSLSDIDISVLVVEPLTFQTIGTE